MYSNMNINSYGNRHLYEVLNESPEAHFLRKSIQQISLRPNFTLQSLEADLQQFIGKLQVTEVHQQNLHLPIQDIGHLAVNENVSDFEKPLTINAMLEMGDAELENICKYFISVPTNRQPLYMRSNSSSSVSTSHSAEGPVSLVGSAPGAEGFYRKITGRTNGLQGDAKKAVQSSTDELSSSEELAQNWHVCSEVCPCRNKDKDKRHRRKKTSQQKSSKVDPNKVCTFCYKNQEVPELYSNHLLKDKKGITTCPVLQLIVCKFCGATGNRAHTPGYCPENPKFKDKNLACKQKIKA